MKKKLSLLALLVTAPLLTQCASQDQVNRLEYQLRVINQKLQKIENNTVNQIQKRQAASSGQLDLLQNEVLSLKSQLEETNHLNRRLKEQNKEFEDHFNSYVQTETSKRAEELQRIKMEQEKKEQLLAEINEKLRVQQANVRAIQQARVREAERRAEAARKAAELAKKRTTTLSSSKVPVIRATKLKIKHSVPVAPVAKQESSPTVTTKPPVTEKKKTAQPVNVPASPNTLDKADRLYEQGDYKGAYKIYKAQLKKASDQDTIIAARFMMGECLFSQKQYSLAVVQFQKIISINAEHQRAPAALLRQAEAFEKLNDKETVLLLYNKLVSTHGESKEAEKARAKLAKLQPQSAQ